MAAKSRKANGNTRAKSWRSERYAGALALAKQSGLMNGPRTKVVRGRMPEQLVKQAKARTGVRSDTKLIELALADVAVGDSVMEWLIANRGTVSKDLDLEF